MKVPFEGRPGESVDPAGSKARRAPCCPQVPSLPWGKSPLHVREVIIWLFPLVFSVLLLAAQGFQLQQINYAALPGAVFCSQPYV